MYVASDDEGRGIVPPEFGGEREAEWRDIENKASQALDGEPPILAVDPERQQALLDLMALHLVRSSETLASQNRRIAHRATEMLHEVERDPEYQAILRTEGMSPERGRQTIDEAIRHTDVGFLPGLHREFAFSLPSLLESHRERLHECGVRLHRPKRQTGFLLGDGPAFLSTAGRLGGRTTTLFERLGQIAHGSPLDGDEWCAWMPLTPRLLAVAGPRVLSCAEVRPLAQQYVDQFNIEQCRRSQFRVVLSPDDLARAKEFVQQNATRTPAPVSAYPLQEASPYEMWRR